MTLFNFITGNRDYGPELAEPPVGGLSHQNPGDLTHHREIPVIPRQRPIRAEEAAVLEVRADQWESLAQSTQQGYQAIERIEQADLEMHKAYRGYQAKVSEVDFQKRSADVKYAEQLHELRGKYGGLRSRLAEADTKATVRTNAIKARVHQILTGARSL